MWIFINHFKHEIFWWGLACPDTWLVLWVWGDALCHVGCFEHNPKDVSPCATLHKLLHVTKTIFLELSRSIYIFYIYHISDGISVEWGMAFPAVQRHSKASESRGHPTFPSTWLWLIPALGPSPGERGMARETAGDQKRAGSVLLAQVQDPSRAEKIFLPAHTNPLSLLQISPYYRLESEESTVIEFNFNKLQYFAITTTYQQFLCCPYFPKNTWPEKHYN